MKIFAIYDILLVKKASRWQNPTKAHGKGATKMKCIYCGNEESKVLDSRSSDDSIRRRRECLKCGRRFTTYEAVEALPFLIVKRDGSRQSYDPNKLNTGLMKACEKRPVSEQQISDIVSNIEKTIHGKHLQEIKSGELGDMALDALHQLDEIAAVRYAIVLKNIPDINTLKFLLDNL